MDTLKKNQHNLEFLCRDCNSAVYFSVLDNQDLAKTLTCEKCKKKYVLGSQILDQLKQFEALCKQIQLSKNIFGQAAIAIDVGPHQVKIPFQLLLTRLSSVLELNVGGENTTIAFRVDTLKGHSLGEN